MRACVPKFTPRSGNIMRNNNNNSSNNCNKCILPFGTVFQWSSSSLFNHSPSAFAYPSPWTAARHLWHLLFGCCLCMLLALLLLLLRLHLAFSIWSLVCLVIWPAESTAFAACCIFGCKHPVAVAVVAVAVAAAYRCLNYTLPPSFLQLRFVCWPCSAS